MSFSTLSWLYQLLSFVTFIIINLCFGLIIYKIRPRKITSLVRFLEVLCETFHVKLLEQCLEHSISQVLAIIITSMISENLHEKRTLRSLSLTVDPDWVGGNCMLWWIWESFRSHLIPYARRGSSYCLGKKENPQNFVDLISGLLKRGEVNCSKVQKLIFPIIFLPQFKNII